MTFLASIGSISHGTMLPSDLIPCFAAELKSYDTGAFAKLIQEAEALEESEEYDSEEAGFILEELFNALNEFAPPYCYFGANEGDGADYGFWPSMDSIDELDKFNDLSEVPDDQSDDFVVVNDHGNVSLYSADKTPIWDIV